MLKPIIRVSLAIAIMFILFALGARSTTASPTESLDTASPAAAVDDDDEAEPMACTNKFCEKECPKLHHCTGICGPHGGCLCVGTPPNCPII